jgi:hypothetical protein
MPILIKNKKSGKITAVAKTQRARGLFLNQQALILIVPVVRLELTRARGPGDFKSKTHKNRVRSTCSKIQ